MALQLLLLLSLCGLIAGDISRKWPAVFGAPEKSSSRTRCALYETRESFDERVPVGCGPGEICRPESQICVIQKLCKRPYGRCESQKNLGELFPDVGKLEKSADLLALEAEQHIIAFEKNLLRGIRAAEKFESSTTSTESTSTTEWGEGTTEWYDDTTEYSDASSSSTGSTTEWDGASTEEWWSTTDFSTTEYDGPPLLKNGQRPRSILILAAPQPEAQLHGMFPGSEEWYTTEDYETSSRTYGPTDSTTEWDDTTEKWSDSSTISTEATTFMTESTTMDPNDPMSSWPAGVSCEDHFAKAGYKAKSALNSCLIFFKRNRNWHQAEKFCEQILPVAGHLVILDTKDKMTEFKQVLNEWNVPDLDIWTGLFDKDGDRKWYKSSSYPKLVEQDQIPWARGEPNDSNSRGPERYVNYSPHIGGLNDNHFAFKSASVCQIDNV